MKERKGDPRIYVITCFFFLCVICGGVLLGLYIFLPETFSESWYPIAGMVLVGIPWLFWLFAYIYECFSPSVNVYNHQSSAATTPSSPTPAKVSTAPRASSCEAESPQLQSPVSPGRRVHFGAVVVMGSEEKKDMNGEDHHHHQNGTGEEGHLTTMPETDQGESADQEMVSKKASVRPKESEIPLAYSS